MSSTAVEPKPLYNTLYQVLRIKHNASQVEIKAAYRSLAKQYHPDAAADIDGADFIQIHSAYATLSDPVARANYDKSIGAHATLSYSASNLSRYGRTRTWETDQCW